MSEALKIKTLILIMIASILLICSNSMPLVNAQPTQTSTTINADPYLPREMDCTIEAILKDENDNPLQNFDIDFLYTCDDHTHLIDTIKTDSNGVASIELTDDIPPYFNYPRLSPTQTRRSVLFKINAVFEGTTTYAKSSSEDVYVAFVLTDYTLYLVGGILIVVAIFGVVEFVVFRRRKKAIPMSMTKGRKNES
jgi:hypothetical protein